MGEKPMKWRVSFSFLEQMCPSRPTREGTEESIRDQVKGLRELEKLPVQDLNRVWDIVVERTATEWERVDVEAESHG